MDMNNIEQMKALIAQLELLGQAEVTDEIQALKQKVAELEAKAIVEAEQVGEELVTAEQTFIQKYGQATAHGVEIVLLLVIVGKLLGAM